MHTLGFALVPADFRRRVFLKSMEDKRCAPGSSWDHLVKRCMEVPQGQLQPSTDPSPILRTSLRGPCPPIPAVWISVAVVVNGSILALLLWFILYKTERRRGHSTVATEAEVSGEMPPARRQDPLEVAEEGELLPSPFLNQNGGLQGCQERELPVWREAVEREESGEGGVYACSGRKDHGIPLPATELGGAALVTTKTVQCTG